MFSNNCSKSHDNPNGNTSEETSEVCSLGVRAIYWVVIGGDALTVAFPSPMRIWGF